MSREAFYERVRAATASGRQYRVHTREVPPEAGYIGAGDDPIAWMAREVNEVGGTSYIAADNGEARRILGELLERYGCRTALCWQHEVLDRVGLGELLAERSVERLSYDSLAQLEPAPRREQLMVADIGISSVWYAVAETGTLAVTSSPGTERVASLLPPVHIAVVAAEQVLPDLFDLFARLGEVGWDNLPSNLTLITGPSKTGDIELTLTTGVHGPGQWHVVLIR